MFHIMTAANKAVERHFLTSWDRREEQEMIGLQGAAACRDSQFSTGFKLLTSIQSKTDIADKMVLFLIPLYQNNFTLKSSPGNEAERFK